MSNREKILLGTSIVGIGGAIVAGYYCIIFKQAIELLVEERNESLKRPFMGFVCAKPDEE